MVPNTGLRVVLCLVFLSLGCGQTAPSDDAAASPPVDDGAGVARPVEDAVVVLFIVDGVSAETISTAVANGAETTASVLRQGVTVETTYCTSPAPRLRLPDDSLPWGGSTSSNVAMHTGTHLFESSHIDDIFLNAKDAGIVSVFAGGSRNYGVFDNADHLYYGGDELTDQLVVNRGLEHLNHDAARLLRLHLQHIRDAWNGPADTTNPDSDYIRYYVNTVDPLLARLIAGLKEAGAWERTYLILGSDHGMGQTSESNHPQSVLSSWQTFMAFHGPGIKQGATIPYAEGPDVAVMANYFLGLPPLEGHLGENVPAAIRGVTGTFLAHILEGGPAAIDHPRLIERYLQSGLPRGDEYVDYRAAMLKLLAREQ